MSLLRLPESILPALRCPTCKSTLSVLEAQAIIRCDSSACSKEYPIVEGVPVLLDDCTGVARISDYTKSPAPPAPPSTDSLTLQRIKYRWKRLRKRLRPVLARGPRISRNLAADANYQDFLSRLPDRSPGGHVLVVGGRWVGEGLAGALESSRATFVETDIEIGPRTMLVCDAHNIPFECGAFVGTISQAVLEHVADPGQCVDELHRVLGERGIVYAETPFMQQVHGGAYDFTRFSLLGHRRLFRRFDEIESGLCCGPGMALAWSYKYFLMSFSANRSVRNFLGKFAEWTAFWLKFFDPMLAKKEASLDAASAVYFLGIKSESILSDRDLLSHYRGGNRARPWGDP